MKGFWARLSYYFLAFGVPLLIVLPLIGPYGTSTMHFLRTGEWNGWEVSQALRALKGGLVITPFASVIFTAYEIGKFRGWSERLNVLVVLLLGALMFVSIWWVKQL
ncbi:hypothetical protein ACLIKD_00325 [Azonexus sp. IMCC34842]|uniref:hypothetical protein n=1 Tax=Azonexus sp. IMCC34842 TaxID=3420950 RepID=UPI003D096EAA